VCGSDALDAQGVLKRTAQIVRGWAVGEGCSSAELLYAISEAGLVGHQRDDYLWHPSSRRRRRSGPTMMHRGRDPREERLLIDLTGRDAAELVID